MENKTNSKVELFERSPWRAIAGMCVPSLISIVVMMLYNMADMYFVGWMGSDAAVAAVSMSNPIFSLLMAVSTMLGNGGCTKIAQALGRGDTDAVRRFTSLCFWASIGFGLIFAAVIWIWQVPLLHFLGAVEELRVPTRSYILIIALGAPIVLLNHTLGSALRGEGEVKAGLYGHMISTFGNILLDSIFIMPWGFGLGVGGAAAATVLGNALALCYYFLYRRFGKSGCVLETRPRYASSLRELAGILALGLPNAISTGLSGFSQTFSNKLLVEYGTAAVAAMAAGSRAVMVNTMIAMGLCMGVQPLLAFWYGRRDWSHLKGIMRRMLILTVGVSTALTAAVYLGRGVVVQLFVHDAATIELGKHLSGYLLLAGPFIGIYYLATNFLQASGAAAGAAVCSALRQGLLLIPLLYLMNALLGLDGLAVAHFLSDGFAIIFTAALAVYYFRRASRVPASDAENHPQKS